MDRPLDPKLIVNLAQTVVEQVAPQEQFQFSSISEAYKSKPKRVGKRQRARDMGFASAHAVKPLLTPRILLILHQAFFLMRIDNTKKRRWFLLRSLRKNSFNASRKEKNEQSLPDFSSEELAHIHEFIFEAARANKFTDTEAQQFANIIVDRLDITQTLRELT